MNKYDPLWNRIKSGVDSIKPTHDETNISEIFPCTLMHILGGGILSCTTGYQFVGEEYCLARQNIRLPNSRHIKCVVLLSKHS